MLIGKINKGKSFKGKKFPEIHISDYWNLAHELGKAAGIYQASPNTKREATLFCRLFTLIGP